MRLDGEIASSSAKELDRSCFGAVSLHRSTARYSSEVREIKMAAGEERGSRAPRADPLFRMVTA